MVEVKQREIWVDNVKVIACILVVLGHFFQSMTKSNVLRKMIYISGLTRQFITSMFRCSSSVLVICIRN